MEKLFSSCIFMFTLFLFTTACNKVIINSYPDEEIMTSRFNAKLNNNSCAVITAVIGAPYEFEGGVWIPNSIYWTNKGGKKFIEVIPEGEESFFINASDVTGSYSWAKQIESPYGEFSFRTITRTGGSPGEGSICEIKDWSIAIDPPF